jgi:hypothetical protein
MKLCTVATHPAKLTQEWGASSVLSAQQITFVSRRKSSKRPLFIGKWIEGNVPFELSGTMTTWPELFLRLRQRRPPWSPTHPHPFHTRGRGCHYFLWKPIMKPVIEGNHEATKALWLSGAGVIIAMLMWTIMMLLFY